MEEDLSDDEFFRRMPPGYLFQPRDDELIYYLILKIKNEPLPRNRIHVVNLYESNPENLAEKYKASGKNEWYLFTSRQKKYKKGSRPDRVAGDGYWKTVGSDIPIKHINGGDEEIGCKKSLVYLRGKPPGIKTDWMMTEFRVKNAPAPLQTADNSNNMRLDDCVLCRMYKNTRKLGGTKRNRVENDDNVEEIESKNIPNDSTNELWDYPQAPLDVSPSVRFFSRGNPAVGSMVPFDHQPTGLWSVDAMNNNFSAQMTFAPPNHRHINHFTSGGNWPYYQHHQMNHTPPMRIRGSLDELGLDMWGPQSNLMVDGLDH